MFEITTDTSNKDIPAGMDVWQARDYYLSMHGLFKGVMPEPVIEPYDDKWVFRADLAPAGLKAFGAEKVIATCDKDVLVYCAPRVGHAMQAIMTLAKAYGKKCVFFCPAAKEASKHQSVLKPLGADLRFIRTAAMPMLNSYARKWAEKHGAQYLPFGLANLPGVTAGLVATAVKISEQLGQDPSEFYMAVSTGTATRALQIGWPEAEAKGVAVARNMHKGEIGRAELISAQIPFLRSVKESEMPHFPTTANYDAKAWELFKILGKPGSIFINVGADAHIETLYNTNLPKTIDSYREWNDLRDLERGL